MGIEPERLQLVWASAAEGTRLANEIARVTEEVRALGPLNWPAGRNGHLDAAGLEEAWEATGGEPGGPPETPGGENPEHAAEAKR